MRVQSKTPISEAHLHSKHPLQAAITQSREWVQRVVSVLEWACRARKLTTQDQKIVEEVVKVCKMMSNTPPRTRSNVCFLYDSGSDAHITNDKRVFVEGTLKSCNVKFMCAGLAMMNK